MKNTRHENTQDQSREIQELTLNEAEHVSGGEIVTGSGVRLVNDGGTGASFLE